MALIHLKTNNLKRLKAAKLLFRERRKRAKLRPVCSEFAQISVLGQRLGGGRDPRSYRSRTTRPRPSACRSRSRPNCMNSWTFFRSGETFSLRIISAAPRAAMNASRVVAGSYSLVLASPVSTSAKSASSFSTK
eukprot:951517-Prymnesium_polylepis.2